MRWRSAPLTQLCRQTADTQSTSHILILMFWPSLGKKAHRWLQPMFITNRACKTNLFSISIYLFGPSRFCSFVSHTTQMFLNRFERKKWFILFQTRKQACCLSQNLFVTVFLKIIMSMGKVKCYLLLVQQQFYEMHVALNCCINHDCLHGAPHHHQSSLEK